LLHGFYSPSNEIYLWNGPGYPLLLSPFLAIGLSIKYCILLNSFFQYISVVFLYKTLRLYTGNKAALLFSIFWACYYIAFKEMTLLYTESLANMLVCLFLYHLSLTLSGFNKNWRHLILSGFLLAYLVLTKIIFGYVILALLVLMLFLFLAKRNENHKKAFLIVLLALLFNLPYLFYTWKLTGKAFYWGNSGGMSLYWASTPVEGEFGDWNDDHFTAYCGYDSNVECNAKLFALNHQTDYDSIYQFKGVARDEAFMKKGIANIKKYPTKYFKNCIANLSRLFFGIPSSYSFVRFQNILRIPPGAVVMIMCLFSITMIFFQWKRLPFVLLCSVFLLFLYLGASISVSAYQRQLTVAVPLIILVTGYLFSKTISVKSE
jgi:4-amino-4-deoxy-L-arabinose transferase-like glycosyltransferase